MEERCENIIFEGLVSQFFIHLPFGQSLISQLLFPLAKANIYRNKDIKFDVVIDNN